MCLSTVIKVTDGQAEEVCSQVSEAEVGEGVVMQRRSSRLEPMWKKSHRRATFTWNGANPSSRAAANSM